MRETFRENFKNVKKAIVEIESRLQRQGGVQLIGASKNVPTKLLYLAHEAGLKCFGENRAQELKMKAPQMPRDCEWHFIGPLQTNKVKDVIPWVTLIHSVDRADLVEEIEKRAESRGKTQKVLVEVNIGGEASKHGVASEKALELVEKVNQCRHLEVHGLMTVAPFHVDLERVRPFFQQLRELRDSIEKQSGMLLPELSMGMSHDYKVAIEEGATMVRIGTALFGEIRKEAKLLSSESP